MFEWRPLIYLSALRSTRKVECVRGKTDPISLCHNMFHLQMGREEEEKNHNNSQPQMLLSLSPPFGGRMTRNDYGNASMQLWRSGRKKKMWRKIANSVSKITLLTHKYLCLCTDPKFSPYRTTLGGRSNFLGCPVRHRGAAAKPARLSLGKNTTVFFIVGLESPCVRRGFAIASHHFHCLFWV